MKLKRFLLLAVVSLFTTALHAQNVYVLNAHSKIEPVTRAVTGGFETSGKALLAAYGAKLTTNLVIEGSSADLTLPMGANYFYIYTSPQIPIKSWKLVPIEKNKKKKTRRLPYAKTGAYTGTKANLKDEVEMRYEKISDNIYRLTPTETLYPGEYALFRMETGVPAEVYDFRVDSSLSPALELPKDDVILAAFSSQATPANNSDSNHNQQSDDHDLMQGSKALLSDVDINIPQTKKTAENTFALIISNENYKQVENVPFAHNDGKVFEQYLKLAIGVPANHITHLQDASLSDIKFALNKLKDITEAYEGDSKIIVHYSGHGIPDESTSEGYLLPADGYAKDPTTALKLTDLYQTLGNMNAKSLILFMDACFSGAQRSGGMIASARGVSIKVREDKPIGNLVVISAAQGDQTAYPYTDKEHGLMTYFLLKKIQETNGDVKLGELGDYITTQVKRTALVENGKAQVPSVYANETNTNWRNQTLR